MIGLLDDQSQSISRVSPTTGQEDVWANTGCAKQSITIVMTAALCARHSIASLVLFENKWCSWKLHVPHNGISLLARLPLCPTHVTQPNMSDRSFPFPGWIQTVRTTGCWVLQQDRVPAWIIIIAKELPQATWYHHMHKQAKAFLSWNSHQTQR